MRVSSLTAWLVATAGVGLAVACKFGTPTSSILDYGSGVSGAVGTTYYPYDAADAVNMGPGHFSCSQFNGETQWYIAPSDTFGDQSLWAGPPCPQNPSGGPPNCAAVMTTCGVKVKVSCASNCKPGAPDVVAVVTDVCPLNHPNNKSNHACQGGPHFDIGKPIWELMHNANDNISVRYQVVDASTPLGPNNGATSPAQKGPTQAQTVPTVPSNPQAAPKQTSPSGSATQSAPSAGVGMATTSNFAQPSAAPTASTPSPTPTPSAPSPTPTPSAPSSPTPGASPAAPTGGTQGKWCDPYNASSCFPYCTNGSNTGNSFGWQPELGGPNGGSCRVP